MANILPLLLPHSQNLIPLNSEAEQNVQNVTLGLDFSSRLSKTIWMPHLLLPQGKVQAASVIPTPQR